MFATWVTNKELPKDFILAFNLALEYGLKNMEKAINLEGINYPNCNNPSKYLNHRISYVLDAEKKKGMELFLNKINC